MRYAGYGELSSADVALIESSPPSAIPVVSPTSEEHEKHDDDQDGCHVFLQTFIGNLVRNLSPLVRLVSCRWCPCYKYVSLYRP